MSRRNWAEIAGFFLAIIVGWAAGLAVGWMLAPHYWLSLTSAVGLSIGVGLYLGALTRG
jgi:hypothetical protein